MGWDRLILVEEAESGRGGERESGDDIYGERRGRSICWRGRQIDVMEFSGEPPFPFSSGNRNGRSGLS